MLLCEKLVDNLAPVTSTCLRKRRVHRTLFPGSV